MAGSICSARVRLLEAGPVAGCGSICSALVNLFCAGQSVRRGSPTPPKPLTVGLQRPRRKTLVARRMVCEEVLEGGDLSVGGGAGSETRAQHGVRAPRPTSGQSPCQHGVRPAPNKRSATRAQHEGRALRSSQRPATPTPPVRRPTREARSGLHGIRRAILAGREIHSEIGASRTTR